MAGRILGIVHQIHEKFVKQLDGSTYGSTNCTMAAGCSLTYRHTHGRIVRTGGQMRAYTGDTVGGTNLNQLHDALTRLGLTGLLGPFRGLAMSTFYARLREGRGAVAQGSARATYGTKWRASFTFRGNHAWYVARGRNWDASGRPGEVEVYDPLADGRKAGIATSPFWLPRSYFEKFCAYLAFGNEILGFGKVYALLSQITIPHRHLRYGGVAFRASLAVKPGYNVRSKPGGTVVGTTRTGDHFDAWQKLSTGPSKGGSRVWYGDHSGTRWIHVSAKK